MRRLIEMLLLACVAAVLLSGCALRVSRDDFNRFNAILEPEDWNIIDWRFPTSVSQGPLEGPKRLRPEYPAIGVPWATGNPITFPPPDTKQTPLRDDSASLPPAQHAEPCAQCAMPPSPDAAAARPRAGDLAASR